MKRALKKPSVVVAVVIAMCIGIGIVLANKRSPVKRFHIVYEGRVYRSGFPTAAGLAALMEKRPVKTVVSLSGDTTKEYQDLYAFTASSHLHHVSMPMGASLGARRARKRSPSSTWSPTRTTGPCSSIAAPVSSARVG